ncbi:MAG: sulfatase [Bryobacterales bacterium]|nr:sulfatase [Bryobacterales bacterium]
MSAFQLSRRRMLQSASSAPALAQTRPALPNLVFLISDDHSWDGLGCYGNPHVRTPRLDRLAREGMRFNHCFVSSPQCSPNRSSLFTGCSPHTTATSRLHTPLPAWEPTFLEPLKERGYFTGAFRKVHQGAQFDRRWDFYGGPSVPFENFFDALPAGRPFFLQFGSTDPHRPYRPGAFSPPHDPRSLRVPPFLPGTPEVRQDLAHYYDAIARLDSECGRLLDLLQARNLAGNTLVVFTGDNGMPFPRAKGACYDPGIRVPLLARWPGRIAPGSVRDELIAHVDLPVTWLQAAGVEKPPKMQGRGFLDLLLGRSFQPRDAVFSERNWHDNFDPIRSVRTRRHKLIFNAAPHFPYRPAWDLADSPTWAAIQRLGRRGELKPEHLSMLEPSRPLLELYDLESDPDEFRNLATDPAHAATLEDLKRRLSAWMHATYDFLPPAYAQPGEPAGRGWPVSL